MVEYEVVDQTTGKESMIINEAADSAFKEKATDTMKLGLRLSITIIPVILIALTYLIFRRKFIITEDYYERIVLEIKARIKETTIENES